MIHPRLPKPKHRICKLGGGGGGATKLESPRVPLSINNGGPVRGGSSRVEREAAAGGGLEESPLPPWASCFPLPSPSPHVPPSLDEGAGMQWLPSSPPSSPSPSAPPSSGASCVCSRCTRKVRDAAASGSNNSNGSSREQQQQQEPSSSAAIVVGGGLTAGDGVERGSFGPARGGGGEEDGSSPSCETAAEGSSDADVLMHDSPISGLPADIGLMCLYRAPRRLHPLLRTVCKTWSCILKSEEFYQQRKRLGLSEKWLYVLASSRSSGEMTWQAFDPARAMWHPVPSLPFESQKVRGVASVVLPDGRLLVCGGMTWDCRPLDSMYWYDPITDRWERGVIMRTPRSCFATAVIDGRLFVAGGTGIESSELSSAEVYDPVTHSWAPIASMHGELPRYDSAVLEGKLHITEGWTWPYHFSPRGEVYDPQADTWQPMEVGMKEGWTGPSTVVDQSLLLVPEIEEVGQLSSGRRVKMYDPNADTWRTLDGPPVPREVEPPLAVASIGRRIYVVGRQLSLAYADLIIKRASEGASEGVREYAMGDWTHVEGGDDASFKHAIVCKVLEA